MLRIKYLQLEILKDNGITGEVHYVTTEDGYILTNYRINGGENSTPVVLGTGITFTGSSWLMRGRNDSIAYLLADQGYDVWLVNNRGTDDGMKHVNLTSDDSKFWDFTFHEMGIYDMPAVIEYITKLTKQKLFYIGYSQSSTFGFIMASKRLDIAKKIRLMIHLAPIAYVTHIKGALGLFHTPLYYIIQDIWNSFFAGASRGSPLKSIIHHYQNLMSGKFRQFNYGEKENMKIYNSTSPPDYNLTAIDVPTVFFAAKNDWLADFDDAKKVYNMLANGKGFNVVNYESFAHLDYVWAKDIKKLINDPIINLLN
ncbi:lipase 1-like, partial [Aphidius gifuensis]|uniref:lipase 1-like n=1 Tax=Aphidius gifuensis TaxID=684658 RepID=UPI001CDCC4AD